MRTSLTLLALPLLAPLAGRLLAEPVIVAELVEEEKLGLGDVEKRVPADKLFEQQVEMVRKSLLPMASFELSFFKRACEPSAEQMQQAQTIAREALDKYSVDWKKNGMQLGDGQRQIAFAVQNGAQIQVQPAIQPAAINRIVSTISEPMTLALHTDFKNLLDDPQQQAYEEELKSRDQFEQQAVIEFLLVILDDKLNLTPRQCEQIADGMRARWGEGWAPPLSMMANFGEYFPPIPDAALVPHLDTQQIDVWRTARIVRFSSSNVHNNSFFPNEFDLDPPAPSNGSEQ